MATFQYRYDLNSQIEMKDTDCTEDNFFPLQMDDTLVKFSQDEQETKKDDSTLDKLKLCLDQQFRGNVDTAEFKLCKELLKNWSLLSSNPSVLRKSSKIRDLESKLNERVTHFVVCKEFIEL